MLCVKNGFFYILLSYSCGVLPRKVDLRLLQRNMVNVVINLEKE